MNETMRKWLTETERYGGRDFGREKGEKSKKGEQVEKRGIVEN